MDDVSGSAIGAAEMRAEESLRLDRLFDDPYVATFVSAASPPTPTVSSSAEIATRTRFYDDFTERASANGCRQVVLLGAGLDTRAFRLDWPTETRVFELDLPGLFAFKERVLAEVGAKPKCAREIVAVDLRDGWPARLQGAGFDPNAPAVWIAEGLSSCLAPDDTKRLLAGVGALSAAGSRLAFDCDNFDPVLWLRGPSWEVRTHDRGAAGHGLRTAATSGGDRWFRDRRTQILTSDAQRGREGLVPAVGLTLL